MAHETLSIHQTEEAFVTEDGDRKRIKLLYHSAAMRCSSSGRRYKVAIIHSREEEEEYKKGKDWELLDSVSPAYIYIARHLLIPLASLLFSHFFWRGG